MWDPRRLLWIDSLGGLAVGAGMLALSGWLATVYGFSHRFVLGLAAANLGYGTYSFALARRAVRPLARIVVLVIANAAWAVFCVVAAVALAASASPFGLAHLALEGAWVGGLAVLEWRHREALRTAPSQTDAS